MADTDVSPKDVAEAAAFMQNFLLSKIPDGDFTEGSPLYDHTIQGIAFVFAYLRKQVGIVRARQSLLTLVNLPPEESVDDATNAILANLVLTRTPGQFARGPGVIHLSARSDLLVTTTTRFFKTNAHVFILESSSDVFIPASELRAELGADGRTTSWVTPSLPFIAARTGRDYNLAAGAFTGFTRFHPYVTLVENIADFTGGDGTQDTTSFIESANTALSLRALLNPNSNSAVLKPKFAISTVTTIGAGTAEMTRDVVTELGAGITLHVGGHMDIYVRKDVQQATERLVVGSTYARPDGRVVRLQWNGSPSDVNFVTGAGITAPVVAGDVLNISAGLPEAPFAFKVVGVEPQALLISSRVPFSEGTMELSAPMVLGLSVGNNYPRFDNKVASTFSSQFATTSRMVVSNGVVLAPVPIYRVKRVEVINATASELDPYKDPTTNTLIFTQRVNALPTSAPSPGDTLPFTLNTLAPAEAQSGIGITTLSIGWPGVSFDGLTVEVVYDTVSSFGAIDAFVRDEYERPGCASTLPKGFHPIYLSFTIPYRIPPVQRDVLGQASPAFDEAVVAAFLGVYVSNYQGIGGIDQSLLATEARASAGVEVSIYPFQIFYDLLAPDGKVYHFSTSDVVTVFPDGTTTAQLLNPEDFGLPSTGYYSQLKKRLSDFGVSDRTTRYLVAPGTVTLLRRS